MAQMTLEEKIGQLNQLVGRDLTGTDSNTGQLQKIREGKVGSMLGVIGASRIRMVQKTAVEESRLGIPIIFGLDVIHGYNATFPIPLAMSCSWDIEGIENAARIAATEASCSGICWTFTPMCDIARDARWGRIAEGAGEDPYLGGEISAAQVRGFQRNLSDSTDIAACVKHFALYGAPVAGRDYAAAEMSRQQMYNEYLPPYRAAVKAGALTVMTSFNEFESVPMTLNRYMVTDVLRGDFGFKGMVVTDYTAIAECIAHGAVKDKLEGAVRAIGAGIDMDMVDEAFIDNLAEAVRRGMVSEKAIDKACRRVLELKEALGLFDDPYKYCREEMEEHYRHSDEFRPALRKMASESIVLLKNEGGLLPLREGTRIAVIGPLGNLPMEMEGAWSTNGAIRRGGVYGTPVTLYKGLCDRFGAGNVTFATGCRIIGDTDIIRKTARTTDGMELERSGESLRSEALRKAREADVVIAAMGETANMSGEGCSRAEITIPEPQRSLLRDLVATGKKVVLVTMAGRPLILDWESGNIPAIVNAWHLGSEAGNAIADILSGDVNPSGRLTTTIPRSVGQIPIYYNHKNTGRPHGDAEPFHRFSSCYCDIPNGPQYYFGYGLSYSEIEYSDAALSADSLSRKDLPLDVSVRLTNRSGRDAVEVAQLYIHDKAASSTRPVMELKGFKRVTVPAGDSVEVRFTLTEESLGFYNHELEFVTEEGDFEIMVGPCADPARLTSLPFRLI